jgi:hypothetical protein
MSPARGPTTDLVDSQASYFLRVEAATRGHPQQHDRLDGTGSYYFQWKWTKMRPKFFESFSIR